MITILNKPASINDLKKFLIKNLKPNQVHINYAQNFETGAWEYRFEDFADTDVCSIICDSPAAVADRFVRELGKYRFERIEAKRFSGKNVYIIAA